MSVFGRWSIECLGKAFNISAFREAGLEDLSFHRGRIPEPLWEVRWLSCFSPLFMPVRNCPLFDPSDNQMSWVISIDWPQKGGGPSCVARLLRYHGCWLQPPHLAEPDGCDSLQAGKVLLIFHLSNFPHHTQEMLLHYTKLHSFLFHKSPALSTRQIPLYLFIQRNLFPRSLQYPTVSIWGTTI